MKPKFDPVSHSYIIGAQASRVLLVMGSLLNNQPEVCEFEVTTGELMVRIGGKPAATSAHHGRTIVGRTA